MGYRSIYECIIEYIRLFTEMLQLLNKPQDETEDIKVFFELRKKCIMEKESVSDIFLPTSYLRESCVPDETSYWLIMFAFCCELEEGLCISFRKEFNEKWPTLQYALHIFSEVMPVSFDIIVRLCKEKEALNDILLSYSEDAGEEGMLSRPLLLNRMAFYFLLTGELKPEKWYGQPPVLMTGVEDLILPLHEREKDIICRGIDSGEVFRIHMHGGSGSGKHTLLNLICNKRQINAVFIKTDKMSKDEKTFHNRDCRELRLICRLLNPLVIIEFKKDLDFDLHTDGNGFTHASYPEMFTYIEYLLTEVIDNQPVILFTETREWARFVEKGNFADIRLDLRGYLSSEEKRLALKTWLAPDEFREWQAEFIYGYRLNIGELKQKLTSVKLWAEANQASVTDETVWEAGIKKKSDYSRLGKIIEADYALEEIILPKECREQIDTVIEVAKGWMGKSSQGLNILFHGSSGTGKTMAASIIAKKLRLPLFKVDLSQIFDKYIGETEKHMDEIFYIAQREHYLLFFDEADALFSKRTDIRDSHDKYANISTSYLLQRIEEYDGILILATNLINHFDDAFVRRIRFVIKFRNLDAEGRKLLWEKSLTEETAEDISFEEIARAAELSPARIKAASQMARLLAACEESDGISKEHIYRALKLEAAKDETVVKKF